MDQYYLKELTVPIPEDRLAVIRKGRAWNTKRTGSIHRKQKTPGWSGE